jgi:hypothetical protein
MRVATGGRDREVGRERAHGLGHAARHAARRHAHVPGALERWKRELVERKETNSNRGLIPVLLIGNSAAGDVFLFRRSTPGIE